MQNITCSIVYLIEGDSVYLAIGKKGMAEGLLSTYGGKLEEGETIVENAVRETSEESGGIKIAPNDLFKACVIVIHTDGEFKGLSRPEARTIELHVYRSERWLGNSSETDSFKKAEKFKIAKIPFKRMFPNNQYWLERALTTHESFTAETWGQKESDGLAHPYKFQFDTIPNQHLLGRP